MVDLVWPDSLITKVCDIDKRNIGVDGTIVAQGAASDISVMECWGGAMLQVHLLGAFGVESNHRPVHADLGANGRRLAAYLFSFPNRVHRRERLVDLFWPDAGPPQARAAFSTALWRIRRLLSDGQTTKLAIRASSRDVSLEIADAAIVDAHLFRSLALDALAAYRQAPDGRALDKAASLYAGPFLEEFDEDWVLDQRERLHSLYIRALANLMRWLAREVRYEDALLCGRRILATDPMRETIQRAVMLLYVMNGQRGEAIRQFQRCERALRCECNVEPMPETTRLLAMIRSGEVFSRLPQLSEALLVASTQDEPPSSFF